MPARKQEEAPRVVEVVNGRIVDRCSRCRVWVAGIDGRYLPMHLREAGATMGTCKVDGPRPGEHGVAVWPLTAEDDWCGKFTPKGQDSRDV